VKRSRFISFLLGFLFVLGASSIQHVVPFTAGVLPANAAGTVTIYKAPQKGKAQKLLKDGFQAVDFPYAPGDADGKAYFAGPNDRSVAEEYSLNYKDGILEVTIDQATYDSTFKPLEQKHDIKNGRARMELPIPQRLFPTLNKFSRVLKQS
jgi:hypothetical protein